MKELKVKSFLEYLKEKSTEDIKVVVEGTEYIVPKARKEKLEKLLSMIGTIKEHNAN